MSQINYDIAKFLIENKNEILEEKKKAIKNMLDKKQFYRGPSYYIFKDDMKLCIKNCIKPIVLMHFSLTTEEYHDIMQSETLNLILEEYYESTNSL